jgi:thioredoxin reductase (NADPH)
MSDQTPEHATSDYVVLGAEDIERLIPFGCVSETRAAQPLFEAGDESTSFFVVLGGTVDILSANPSGPKLITTHVAGQFLGELNLLIGQRPFVSAVVAEPGSVLAIDLTVFRDIMRTMPDLADIVFKEFVARRTHTIEGSGVNAIRIIGTRFSSRSMALRVFASRSQVPHMWIDLDELDEPTVFLKEIGVDPAGIPVVITPITRLDNPTTVEFARFLGLTHGEQPDHISDVAIVGLGPAGLATAVVSVAEGLDAACLEAVVVGGQAAASSRIENYLGFPNGISGEHLIEAAATQAQRLGARLQSPCPVAALHAVDDIKLIELADGTRIACRTLVIASGARYRRLDIDDLARFEGAGVFYATTDIERRTCRGQHVIVVGGGNSAGQAALSLAKTCASVSLVVRRGKLTDTMSHYLVARIQSDSRIRLIGDSVVRDLGGADSVESAVIENIATGARETLPCRGVFCFTGAVPATDWLAGKVALDRNGFVLTDHDLPAAAQTAASFGGRALLPFETSMPGVFAVGDVRATSQKRVASAVGEGSTVVSSILKALGPRM